jgi:ribonuclease HI
MDLGYTVILASDGSAIRKPDKEHWWCAGGFYGRIYSEHALINEFSKVVQLDNSTNNIGELTGLEMAIDSLKVMGADIGMHFIFLLDSEYTLKSVTKWYNSWKRNMRDGVAYTATGTPVKNWTQIERIHNKLKAVKSKHVFKVRSHVTEKDMQKAFHEFCYVNNESISYGIWSIFNEMNNKCDFIVNEAAEKLRDNR